MLIDVGTYLQDTPDERVNQAILKHAAEFEAGKFFCSGVSPEDWSLVHSLARQDEQIVPFFGVHPWFVDSVSHPWSKQLLHIVSMNMGGGIGLIGLDQSKNGGDYKKQKEFFLHQIQIAEQLSRPIAIHCAEAWDDLLASLRDNKAPHIRFMINSYQGSSETLGQLLSLGAYISFSRKNLLNADIPMLSLVRQVPHDRLLLGTDFPHMDYFFEVDKNISFEMYFKCLHETYAIAAQVIKVEVEDLKETIWNNSIRYLSGNLPSTNKRDH